MEFYNKGIAEENSSQKKKKLKAVAHIPEQIIMEILVRLPAKSLFHFISACKSWHALVSDPEFKDLHLNRTILDDKFSLFLKTSWGCFHLHPSTNLQSHDQPRNLHFQFGNNCKIVGSCNGLVCLCSLNNRFSLVNPATGFYKQLPDSSTNAQKRGSNIDCYYESTGFGYSPCTREYKVTRINYFYKMGCYIDIMKSDTQVYTVGTNSWRRIPSAIVSGVFSPRVSFQGKLFKGYLHWIVVENQNDSNSATILSFDVGDEKFGTLLLPKCISRYPIDLDSACLAVLKECLCILHNINNERLELWVMKAYGERESWSLKFSVIAPMMLQKCKDFTCFRFLQNGEILLISSNGHIFVCDPVNRSFKDLILRRDGINLVICDSSNRNGVEKGVKIDATDYVGKLLSIK